MPRSAHKAQIEVSRVIVDEVRAAAKMRGITVTTAATMALQAWLDREAVMHESIVADAQADADRDHASWLAPLPAGIGA